MFHALSLSEAFEYWTTVPPAKNNEVSVSGDEKCSGGRGGGYNTTRHRSGANAVAGKQDGTRNKQLTCTKPKRDPPPCQFGPCQIMGKNHWINDCDKSSGDQKCAMKAVIAAAKARDGLSRSTRPQKANESCSYTRSSTGSLKGTAGRPSTREGLHTAVQDSSSCTINVAEHNSAIEIFGRCDDGSDDSIISPKLPESATIQGIGKMRCVTPVKLQVSLKAGDEAHSFCFSRTWTVPRTVLHLASGRLALRNITYLVADDEIACEDLLIGLSVLRHLKVDTKTLLETNRASLDGTDSPLDSTCWGSCQQADDCPHELPRE